MPQGRRIPLARVASALKFILIARQWRWTCSRQRPGAEYITMNPNFRNFALWVVIFLLVLALITLFQNPGSRGGGGDIAYSQLLNDADSGRIATVTISGQEISGTTTDGRTFTTYA